MNSIIGKLRTVKGRRFCSISYSSRCVDKPRNIYILVYAEDPKAFRPKTLIGSEENLRHVYEDLGPHDILRAHVLLIPRNLAS